MGHLGGIGRAGESKLGPGLDSQRREWRGPPWPVVVLSGLGRAVGMRGAATTAYFPHLHLAGGKLGQCHCLIGSVTGDPPPGFPRGPWGLQLSESLASLIPRPLAAALQGPGCLRSPGRKRGGRGRSLALPCPATGQGGARSLFLSSLPFLSSFLSPFFPRRSFRKKLSLLSLFS